MSTIHSNIWIIFKPNQLNLSLLMTGFPWRLKTQKYFNLKWLNYKSFVVYSRANRDLKLIFFFGIVIISFEKSVMTPNKKHTYQFWTHFQNDNDIYLILAVHIQNQLVTNVEEKENPLCEKCPNTELFLVRIFLYSDWIYGDLLCISPYSVWLQENKDQK